MPNNSQHSALAPRYGCARARCYRPEQRNPRSFATTVGLEGALDQHVEINELHVTFEDLPHGLAGGLEPLRPARVLLAKARLLLTFEDDHHVDGAGILRIPQRVCPEQPGVRLLDGLELIHQPDEVRIHAGLQMSLDDLCPHNESLPQSLRSAESNTATEGCQQHKGL